ncbi:MAG: MarR family transcriptional regulator [Anaerolineae bacterium]|nr:MarR family transcriptional regulator [Anaerolineae bacterium]
MTAEIRQAEPLVSPVHFRLLWILRHQSLTLSALAEIQAVSLPTMSNSVTILEERGWVNRTRSEQDRRKVMIELTPIGEAVLEEMQRYTERRIGEIIASVTTAEQEQVAKGLSILERAFATAGGFHSYLKDDEGTCR